ncbi:hypothetical protein PhCBS80983_g02873 [Powellomyces hirtus]|uniref:Fibronectin type-III domain-containing protein n=1 Tax=Powellomyces hirtus TaxID=109895 RepID=A0A507E570_9FUNG|nr:hypothetical protein PhCBS80983_g02873 [Powellomyces hirtus]
MQVKGRWARVNSNGSITPAARHGHRCEVVRYRRSGLQVVSKNEQNAGKSQRRPAEEGFGAESGESDEQDMVTKMVMFWGSDGRDIMTDCFEFDPETSTWTSIPVSTRNNRRPSANDLLPLSASDPPFATAGMAVTSNEHLVYIFGGITQGSLFVNQLLQYDAQNQTLITLASGPESPSARVNATLTYIPENTSSTASSDPYLFLFGGFTPPDTFLNDSPMFNLRTMKWSTARLAGIPPTPREHHSAVFWQSLEGKRRTLVIYGGMCPDPKTRNYPHRLHDIVFLNIDDATWIHPDVRGEIPPGRSKHSSVVFGDRMVVFGGQEGANESMTASVLSGKVFLLNMATLFWENMSLSSADGTQSHVDLPAGRADHGAAIIGGTMFVSMGERKHSKDDSSRSRIAGDMWHLQLGPPLPPDRVSVIRRAAPRAVLEIRWQDSAAWQAGHSYEVQIRVAASDTTADVSKWSTVYRGLEHEVSVTSFNRPDGLQHDISVEAEYDVRVVAVNWAGNSQEWDTKTIGGDAEVFQSAPQSIEIHKISCTPTELGKYGDSSSVAGLEEVPALLLSWCADAAADYRVEARCAIHPGATSSLSDSTDTSPTKRRKIRAGNDVGQEGKGQEREDSGGSSSSVDAWSTWQTVWQGRGGRWKGAVQSLHTLVWRAARPEQHSTAKLGKRTRRDSIEDKGLAVKYKFRVCQTNTSGRRAVKPSEESEIVEFVVDHYVVAHFPTSSPSSSPAHAETIPRKPNGLMQSDNIHATKSPGKNGRARTSSGQTNLKPEDEGQDAYDEEGEEDDDDEEEEEEVIMSVTVGPRASEIPETPKATPTPDVDSSKGRRQKSKALIKDEDDRPLKPPSRQASLKRIPPSSPVLTPKRRGKPSSTKKKSGAAEGNQTPPLKEPTPDAVQDVDIEGSGDSSNEEAAKGAKTTSPEFSINPLAPSFKDLIMDPETGRPELGNVANGFYFNLRFGDRIEVSSDKEAKTHHLWYKARMVHYTPLAHDAWRIKVHYEGYPKTFDEYFSLLPESIQNVREPTEDEDVIVGDMVNEDPYLFDPNSKAKKLHVLNSKEREIAKAGGIVVRNVPGGKKSVG